MTLGGPKGFLLKNHEKKIHIFRSLLTIEERLYRQTNLLASWGASSEGRKFIILSSAQMHAHI